MNIPYLKNGRSGLIVLALSSFLTPAVQADDYKTYVDCLKIKKIKTRIDCYDTFAKGGTYSQKKLEKIKRETFGKVEKKSTTSDDKLMVTIIKVQGGGQKPLTLYTSDGMVWRQKDSGPIGQQKIPFKGTIKKSFMSGYRFSPEGSNRSIAVKRLR